MSKYAFVLPTYGEPYLLGLYDTDNKEEKQKLTDDITRFVTTIEMYTQNPKAQDVMKIHPMFKGTWKAAGALVENKKTNIYLNENGMYECCPNMAVIHFARDYSKWTGTTDPKTLPVKGIPFFGDIVITVPKDVVEKSVDITKFKTEKQYLALLEEEDEDDE